MADNKRFTPSVSLTKSEKNYLQEKADKAGISYTRFIREVALSKRSQDGKVITQAKLMDDLIQQVRAIGKNLNQIAKNGNQFGQVKPERIEAIHQQLDAMRNRIYDQLK